MLWKYVDAGMMYDDGLLTIEGELIEDGGRRRMIDTDKYEGHNLNVKPEDIKHTVSRSTMKEKGMQLYFFIPDNNFEDSKHYRSECSLVTDAPLLLAEVKRLRELKIAEEEELEQLCNRAEFYEGEDTI